jgi:hypothetical protein
MASPISLTIELSRCWTTDRVIGSTTVVILFTTVKNFLNMACQRRVAFILYSITSSALPSSVAGISRPSALAALRLITSSNLVGRSIGNSAG